MVFKPRQCYISIQEIPLTFASTNVLITQIVVSLFALGAISTMCVFLARALAEVILVCNIEISDILKRLYKRFLNRGIIKMPTIVIGLSRNSLDFCSGSLYIVEDC